MTTLPNVIQTSHSEISKNGKEVQQPLAVLDEEFNRWVNRLVHAEQPLDTTNQRKKSQADGAWYLYSMMAAGTS